MWGALIGGVISLIGGRNRARAESKAREEESRYSQDDMRFAADLERRNLREARTAARADSLFDDRRDRRYRIFEDRRNARMLDRERRLNRREANLAAQRDRRLANQQRTRDMKAASRLQKQQQRIDQKAFKAAQFAKRRERNVALRDEAQRFTRLRESAEAAGFNPLTVLGAGFVGPSAVPTGFLSGESVFDARASVSALAAGLGGGTYMSGGGGYSSGFQASYGGRISQSTGSVAAAYQGNASAGRNQAAGVMGDNRNRAAEIASTGSLEALRLGLDAVSLWDQVRGTSANIWSQQQTHSQDAERIALATRELDWMMQQSPTRWTESSLSERAPDAGGGGYSPVRQAQYGQNVADSGLPPNAVPRNPDGTVAERDLAIGGMTFDVSENWTPAQDVADEYGDAAEELIGVPHLLWDVGRNAVRVAPSIWNTYGPRLQPWAASVLSSASSYAADSFTPRPYTYDAAHFP